MRPGRISEYLGMQFAVNAVFGLMFGGGLYLLGIPNATLWGVSAGVLRIVPYAGDCDWVSAAAGGFVGDLSALVGAAGCVGLFLALELSASNFVEPWLYSSRTGISSFALLVSAIFWALIWGWPGLVLSTPLTVCAVVLGRYVPEMSFLHTCWNGCRAFAGGTFLRTSTGDGPARGAGDCRPVCDGASAGGALRHGGDSRRRALRSMIGTKARWMRRGPIFCSLHW